MDLMFLIFFFKQKTAYEIYQCDWSSDVCSSDLNKPKVILIVTFGTIARADVMAESIAEAKEKLKPNIPIITAIRGTGEEKAQEILRSIGLEPLLDTEEAVKRAVELTGRGVK